MAGVSDRLQVFRLARTHDPCLGQARFCGALLGHQYRENVVLIFLHGECYDARLDHERSKFDTHLLTCISNHH